MHATQVQPLRSSFEAAAIGSSELPQSLAQELSPFPQAGARLGEPRKRQDQPRTVIWTAHGVEARLVVRMEDAGLTIVGKPTKTKEDEPLDALRIQFEQTFDELERTEVRRTEDGALEFGGDIRGTDDGVLVTWEGPALVRGVLHAELVDQVLAEIRDARESADDADF